MTIDATPTESHPLTLFLDALAAKGCRVKGGAGGEIMAQCPAHDDQTESLSLREGEGGQVLLHCHAGCEPEAVCDAVGWSLGDLFPRRNGNGNGSSGNGTIYCTERVHIIRDYDGNEIAQHHRQDSSDGNKKMWWTRGGKSGLGGMHTKDLPLFGTELLKSNPDAGTVVVEGEKAAESLQRRGILALGTVTGAGGKTAKCHSSGPLRVLKDRDVVLWPDDDDVGRQHMVLVARGLRGIARSVRILAWKGLKPGDDAADFNGTDDELRELLAGGTPATTAPTPKGGVVLITTKIAEVVDAGLAAVQRSLPESLFQRAGKLVMVRAAEPDSSGGISRSTSPPTAVPVKAPRLRELLASAADWQQMNGTGQATDSLPPVWVAETALHRPSWDDVPVLTAISEIPVLREDGTVAQRPGYDKASGVLFCPGKISYAEVPDNPTADDVAEAYTALCELLVDFSFVNQAARAAAVAAILTIVGRHAVPGPVPMFHFGAPTAGTGKTMLATACAIIATGRSPSVMTPTRDEAERAKEILALGLAGDPVILLDNIEGSFGSAVMAGLLTKPADFQGRVLGLSETARVPMRAVWMSTGNNTQWTGDLARRVVPIEQDAHVESPENRTGWRYSPLQEHAHRQHPMLAVAALTILRAHAVAGRPSAIVDHLGSYEGWDAVIRSAVLWASECDPCAGRKEATASVDNEHQDLVQVLTAWRAAWAMMGGRGTVAQAVTRCYSHLRGLKEGGATLKIDGDLHDAMRLICPTGELDPRQIGRWIQAKVGKIVGGMRFVRESSGSVNAWRVEVD